MGSLADTGLSGLTGIIQGGYTWKPDPTAGTFTASMAKRTAPGPFATAPIVQGKLDGTGTPDALSFSRGELLGNQMQYLYADFDPYQGSIVFWITPEWNGNDGVTHGLFSFAGGSFRGYKHANGNLYFTANGLYVATSVAGWLAGTTYAIVLRWKSYNPIDNSNKLCISINDSHLLGGSGTLTVNAPSATLTLGSVLSASDVPDAIIEGFTIYRRPLFDGTYGVDVGNGDEIALIYAAGAGADPCRITGSWDVCLCVPTNSTAGALTTGTGNAWSHPHGSNIPDVWGMWDGGLPGTPYAVEFDGSSTYIDCGSGATLDDLGTGGAQFTVGAWVRCDVLTGEHVIVGKGAFGTSGWHIEIALSRAYLRVELATTDMICNSGASTLTADGKWHYVAAHYNDTTKTGYISVDGIWGSSHTGVGAWQSDAALNLVMGRTSSPTTFFFGGGQAWVAIWSDDHHGAGTDFDITTCRTPPTPGGNLVECWHMDEGTGATAAAQVTTPANDGTITSGSWSSIWEVESTPVVPQSIEFDGTNDGISFGSGANIDDLPTADCTIELWMRQNTISTYPLTKWTGGADGWRIQVHSSGVVQAVFVHATDNLLLIGTTVITDDVWHHIAVDWDFGTLTGRLFVDGNLEDADSAVGAYQSDAATNCIANGLNAVGNGDFPMAIGWIRLSDSRRYTGNSININGRDNPPGNDANAHLLINMDDGAGTTATDSSGNGYNGTITFGTATRWLNTPDMTMDEPGARIYNNGYNIGSDGANDGITIVETVTAETDYVLRLVGSYGQSGQAWPNVYLYDNDNGAQIGATFSLPRVSDIHTGANNSATLINANGAFTQQLVGWLCYNITDGSSGTITAVSGDKTTITVTLAGGTDNDFDTNDVYVLRPPGNADYCQYPFATESMFVFRTPAGCTSIDIKIRNAAGEGVMQIHQCEVLESLLNNGDMETLAGNPAIPTGWTNVNLDPGDTVAEAAIIHAGAQSLEAATTADTLEAMYIPLGAISVDTYYEYGAFGYCDGASTFVLRHDNNQLYAQAGGVLSHDSYVTAAWRWFGGVARNNVGTGTPFRLAYRSGATGLRYVDDIYLFQLDAVSLTVTPASEANSAEGAGIRVDGKDFLTTTVPVGRIGANQGDVRFGYTPRHGDTEALLFGSDPAMIALLQGDANNWLQLRWTVADTLQLSFNANGAGAQLDTWATGGSAFTPGTTYTFRIRWTGGAMRLYVDGTLRITITAATGFVWPNPTTLYWGSTTGALQQSDAVYSQAS